MLLLPLVWPFPLKTGSMGYHGTNTGIPVSRMVPGRMIWVQPGPYPKFLHRAPFVQKGLQAKSGFEMCFDIGSRHLAGAKTRLESRIKKLMPHRVCRPALLAGNLFPVPGAYKTYG